MKSVIDMSVAGLFLTALLMYDLIIATAVLIPLLWIAFLLHSRLEKKWSKMHFWVAVLGTVLGGVTLLLDDTTFIKVKPTVIYSVFALTLFASRYIGEKPLMQRIPQQAIELPDHIWDRLHLAWAGFFLFCAGMNVVVYQNFDDETWGIYKTFGVTIMMFVFLLCHIPFLHKYLPDETTNGHTESQEQH